MSFETHPVQSLALRRYWTSIEQRLPLLQAYLNAADATEAATVALGRWRAAVRISARDAFASTCANETPRQLRAYALALRSMKRSEREASHTPQKRLETQ